MIAKQNILRLRSQLISYSLVKLFTPNFITKSVQYHPQGSTRGSNGSLEIKIIPFKKHKLEMLIQSTLKQAVKSSFDVDEFAKR